MENKLYCYVDETGQDTQGKMFLVVVVLTNLIHIETIERQLIIIEKIVHKNKLKWQKTKNSTKVTYLREIFKIKELKKSIFYNIYKETKNYTQITSHTIAKTISLNIDYNYTVTVVIDGLNDHEKSVVRSELKKMHIHYQKIRGMKDEQSALLRLADAIAGFLRDMNEKQKYTFQLNKDLNYLTFIQKL